MGQAIDQLTLREYGVGTPLVLVIQKIVTEMLGAR